MLRVLAIPFMKRKITISNILFHYLLTFKIQFILIISFQIFLSSCALKMKFGNMNMNYDEYQGSVKTVKTSTFKAITKNDTVTKGQKVNKPYDYSSNRIAYFDKKGRLISEYNYFSNDTIFQHKKYKYVRKINKLSKFHVGYGIKNYIEQSTKLNYFKRKKSLILYDIDGNIEQESIIQHNILTRKIIYKDYYNNKQYSYSITNLYLNGKSKTSIFYEMNEGIPIIRYKTYFHDGRVILSESYNDVGELTDFTKYTYGVNNNITSNITFNNKNEVTDKCTYNIQGDLLELIYYSSGSITKICHNIYEYDSKNNWIKKIEYEDNKPKYIIFREIEYY